MKKVNQKIKSAVNVNVVNNNNLQKRMVHYMIMAFGLLAVFYILVLMNMVWNIVERKSLQADARNLTNEVGALELKYLTLSDEVDVGMSYKMGFREVKPTFATSSKSLGTLAKVSNEI